MRKHTLSMALLLLTGVASADRIDDLVVAEGLESREQGYVLYVSGELAPDDYLWLSKQFSRCAAIAYVLAEVGTAPGEDKTQHYLHMWANGATASGTYFVKLAGYKPELFDRQLEGQIAYWRTYKDTLFSDSKSGLDEKAKEAIQICSDLQTLQGVVVDTIRRDIYKAE